MDLKGFVRNNSNKRSRRRLAAAFVVLAGLLLLPACSDGGKGAVNIDSEERYPKNVDSSKSLELTGDIAEIDIEGKIASIEVDFSSGNGIASSLKGGFEVADSELQTDLSAEKSGNKIIIAEKHSSEELTIKNSTLKLFVQIPETYAGKLNVKSVSGNVIYKCGDSLENDISIESVSGGVEISIPENAGFTLKNTTTTGKVQNDFNLEKDGGTVGDGKHNIGLKTVTGSIKISKK